MSPDTYYNLNGIALCPSQCLISVNVSSAINKSRLQTETFLFNGTNCSEVFLTCQQTHVIT